MKRLNRLNLFCNSNFALGVMVGMTVSTVLILIGTYQKATFGSMSTVERSGNDYNCKFSIIYNKPPKTAGTFIQASIRNWTDSSPWNMENCRGYRAIETNLYLSDCVPREDDGCTVLSSHMILDRHTRRMITERLPSARFLTSTRYPPHRLLSLFLQIRSLSVDQFAGDDSGKMESLFHSFLEKFNPWTVYNYHTGETRTGACPLTRMEQTDVLLLAGRFDLVVDASLSNYSNVIMEHYGLFKLQMLSEIEQDEPSVNRRGSILYKPSRNTMELIKNVSCVEVELHRALHVRMASLYEQATGNPCINHGNIDSLSTCLDEMERRLMDPSWVL